MLFLLCATEMNILKLSNTKGGDYNVSTKILLASQLPHCLAHVAERLRDDCELSTHNGDERFVAGGVRTSLLSVFCTSRAAGSWDLDHRISTRWASSGRRSARVRLGLEVVVGNIDGFGKRPLAAFFWRRDGLLFDADGSLFGRAGTLRC
ncbi:MAG TPA: hypothetical protein VGM30_01490 [Puia sp.]